jgi:cobalt-zinc-cadmium efflux system outer membrane protein
MRINQCWINTVFWLLLAPVAWAQDKALTAELVSSAPSVSSYNRLIDPMRGLTAAELVRYALAHNGELRAARQMIAEATGRWQQAALKPNPMFETSGTQAANSPDNNQMIGVEWPLELGGRRQARTLVAQREVELRNAEVADFERKLAAEVRQKYAEAIAALRQLKFTEALFDSTRDSQRLVQARVELGKSAPLESSELAVETQRVAAMRLNYESQAEVALLALKQVCGMPPEEALSLRGEFVNEAVLPSPAELLHKALATRPDLLALRAAESLAAAQAEQARREGRVDASLFANYQRMSWGYDVRGFNAAGQLAPVTGVFHYLTFGARWTLPVRNQNQGLIAAAMAALEAARQRREFAELVTRNEITAALLRVEKSRAALAIYRDQVRTPAERNVELVRRTYATGYRTALDYLAAQRRFIEIETGYTDALKESFLALSELAHVTAQPLPQEEKQ